MLKVIAGVIVAAVAVILILAARKPDDFRVERSTSINAPRDKVFALINDFKQWPTWSPWENLDPDMKRTLSGAQSGTGSIYEWSGNSKVGQGRMEISQTTPPEKLVIKLDFLDPFEAHNIAQFDLRPQGEGTEVVWAMHGPAPFMSKLMQVFVSMDRMIGKDFETGLANLKTVAER